VISGSYEQLYAKQVLHSTDSFKNTDSFMNIIIVWICLENDAIVCLFASLLGGATTEKVSGNILSKI